MIKFTNHQEDTVLVTSPFGHREIFAAGETKEVIDVLGPFCTRAGLAPVAAEDQKKTTAAQKKKAAADKAAAKVKTAEVEDHEE